MQIRPSSDVVHFGPFRLDLKAGELSQDGRTVRLQEQPFQILKMLLEHPGEVVAREEIRRALWPNDTVVEFDQSINAAIKKLRLAMQDSAEAPRYVETVARRGYRLLVEVRWDAAGRSPEATGAADDEAAASLSLGTLIGKKVSHYRILEVIGGGGMGVVYKAEDLKLGRRVALKFLPDELGSDPAALERFEREARSASALDHPNICAVYEFGEHDGQPFLAMQFLEGTTLRDRIESASAGTKPFAIDEFLAVAFQIAEGLDAAHRAGIVHRDIKPANIFVTTQGQTKILDFGLAKLALGEADPQSQSVPNKSAADAPPGLDSEDAASVPPDSRFSRTGATMGTVGYMSPEQVRGEKLDARTDLFSFGLVLYEMATGKRAFTGETTAELHDAILTRTPVSVREFNPQIPPKVEEIISRNLEKDREARYQSAAAILADLRPLHDAATAVPSHSSIVPKTYARKRWFQFAVATAVVVGVASAAVFYYRHRVQASRLTEQDTIVLADFANSTGDAIFDDTLRPALKVALQQSPFLSILPEGKVRSTLKLMTRPPDTRLTPEIAREVCQRAGSRAYLAGAIASLGNEYVLGLKAVNCQNGKTLAHEQVTIEDKGKVLAALGETSAKLRAEMGESLASVRKFDAPLDYATTSSLEAMKQWSAGVNVAAQKGPAEALPYEFQAIQLDPNFALAYFGAGTDYYNLQQPAKALEYVTKAFQLRGRVSDQEAQEISSIYYYLTGELEKSAQTYEKTIQVYPRLRVAAFVNLSVVYAAEGEYEKAVDMVRQAIQLKPDAGVMYQNLLQDLRSLQRFDEARQTLQTAQAKKLDIQGLHKEGYLLAFLDGNSEGMAQQAAWFASKPEYAALGFSLESDTEAYSGHQRKAREFGQRAVDAALRADRKETAAAGRLGDALREALFGNAAQARLAAAEALKLAPTSQDVQVAAALAFAMAGDAERAESLAQELNKQYPLDTLLQKLWIPAIQARAALAKGKAAAVTPPPQVVPLEYGYAIWCMHPTYVRGEVYLASGQASAAANEFRKIIEHTGILCNCPDAALARLELARANALEARTVHGLEADAARAGALTAYRDFLTLWKDADPDIPILKQAKAEYAKLQ